MKYAFRLLELHALAKFWRRPTAMTLPKIPSEGPWDSPMNEKKHVECTQNGTAVHCLQVYVALVRRQGPKVLSKSSHQLLFVTI